MRVGDHAISCDKNFRYVLDYIAIHNQLQLLFISSISIFIYHFKNLICKFTLGTQIAS